MFRVKDDTIWGQIRILFLASALLFLANIYFGFYNALSWVYDLLYRGRAP